MVAPANSTDDYWQQAITLFTGYPAPARKDLFDKLVGNDSIPLMQVEIVDSGALPEESLSEVIKNLYWRASNSGTSIEEKNIVVPFYAPKYGEENPGPGTPVKLRSAKIRLLGSAATAGPPMGGVDSTPGDFGDYTDLSLKQYSYGGGMALRQLLDHHTTAGFEWNGLQVDLASAVDTRTFERAAHALSRAAVFFDNQSKVLDSWEARLGPDNPLWRGQASGVFKDLIHKLNKMYGSYEEDIPRISAFGSKQGQQLMNAQQVFINSMLRLHHKWDWWQIWRGNPLRWLHDNLLDLTKQIWENNITKVKWVTHTEKTSAATSSMVQADHKAKDTELVTEPGFQLTHPLYGRYDDLRSWKLIGEQGIREWQNSVISDLGVPARDAIMEVQRAFGVTLNRVVTRSGKSLSDDLVSDKNDKLQDDQKAAQDKADKANEDLLKKQEEAAAEQKKELDEQKKAAKDAQDKQDKYMDDQLKQQKDAQAKQDQQYADQLKAAEEAQAKQDQQYADQQKAAEEAQAKQDQQYADQQKAAEEAQAKQDQQYADQQKAAEEAQAKQDQQYADQQKAAEEAQAKQDQQYADQQKAAEEAQKEQEKQQAQQDAEQQQLLQQQQQEQDQQQQEQEEKQAQQEADLAAQQKAQEQQYLAAQVLAQNQAAGEEERQRKQQAEQEAEQEAQQQQFLDEQQKQQEQQTAELQAQQDEQEAQQQLVQEKQEQQEQQRTEQAQQQADQLAQQQADQLAQQQADLEADQQAREKDLSSQQEKLEKEQAQREQEFQQQLDAQQSSLSTPDFRDSETVLNSDGSVTTDFADGSFTTVDPDEHTAVTVSPDGRVDITDLPDGKSIHNVDGSWTTVNSDGTVTTDYPDGHSVTINPERGLVETVYPDGTSELSPLSPGSALPDYGDDTAQYTSAYEDQLYDDQPLDEDALLGQSTGQNMSSGTSSSPMSPMLPTGTMLSGQTSSSTSERSRTAVAAGRPVTAARTGNQMYDEVAAPGYSTATSSGMPYMPQMGGGGGNGGQGNQTESSDRARSAWEPEEEDVWGTDEGGAPASIGR
ncbi:AAWKG family protein [Streptomyces sp. NBC_00102]|uniref:AAWKG family protein n=1 Tax=Streptomyces sp. NBC_00102 TaxID=2975652 RepID=UPI00224F58D9|nr:AAWKG family protein [Streptomyces sp. NBC_00102]MCX5400451.1 AAWKG family protein [Streptomyces sp. NBC_00102]